MKPRTSILAHNSVKPHIPNMHEKIAQALETLGEGTQESIAAAAHLDRYQVNRRLSELVGLGVIKVCGQEKLTSGRMGQTYCLVQKKVA